MAKILLVEHMKSVRRAIAALLHDVGHTVIEVEDGTDAITQLRNQSFDLVICEVLLATVDGTEVLAYLEKQPDRPPVIAISSGNNQIPAEMALLLVKTKANATLKKPFEDADLLALTEKLLNEPDLTQRVAG